ncbi:MAG: gliding motility-associated C-terminal domain-containing protein [Bacteroidota bacterium]|nr:gliding motility-associated C-terminal domain-containing protein [Bacteroidota bacterium]
MKKWSLVIAMVFAFLSSRATHNRAGEITYKWISGNTYEVTITTYTKDSAPADRCQLTLDWGDGTTSVLFRQNGPVGSCAAPARMGEVLPGDVRKNIYKGVHTYAGPGFYTLSMQDLNRNAGVNNIPNSVQVPFYITTTLNVTQALGPNSSPILLNPPIDDGCINRLYIHNPTAFDPDGDSLGYELIDCKGLGGVSIPETYDPNYVQDPVIIDPVTGDFIWNVPKNQGEYNFAILITEYRRGANGQYQVMGQVTRDMQVRIENCNNQPPVIDPVGPFCVEAGKNLTFSINASDPNGDRMDLTAFGGPFEVSSPAQFSITSSNPGSATATFSWNAECVHVRKQPYYVTFRAKDRPPSGETPLTASITVEIRVVAPSPKNPSASPGLDEINLNWNPDLCTQAIGYKIYRRKGSYGFIPDTCETGIPDYTGYEYLDEVSGWGTTAYKDTNQLEYGVRYCYMVYAFFSDGSESYASVEFCTELPKIVPIITNVDVDRTDANTGRILLSWVPPKQIDSTVFPPPYGYRLERAEGIGGTTFQPLYTFNNFVDTTAVDSLIDTDTRGYRYRVVFLSGNGDAGTSSSASSPYLALRGRDKAIEVDVAGLFPWVNEEFIIYRDDNGNGIFDSITTVENLPYLDTGLVNGETYCYYVTTIGRYTGSGLPEPLFNRSQETCSIPIDTTGPCAPILNATANCELGLLTLTWDNPNDPDCPTDVIAYNVYYKLRETDPWPSQPLASGVIAKTFQVSDGSIVGCYAVTAVDDAPGQPNESGFSNVICIEGCPAIQLPNVFTPDNDGPNNFFRPLRDANGEPIFKDILKFRITIVNRWGVTVWETTDENDFVNEGWNGIDQNTGKEAPEGVYYYILTYEPRTLRQPEELVLKGFIHLFR